MDYPIHIATISIFVAVIGSRPHYQKKCLGAFIPGGEGIQYSDIITLP